MTNPLTRRMSLRTDLLFTILTATAVVLGLFILSGLLSRQFGLEDLGDYLLIRRTGLSLVSLLLVGMHIGLPYYVPRKDGGEIAKSSLTVFLFISVPLLILTWLILSAGIIPGFPNNLALPLVIFSGGYCLHTLNYSLLRGRRQMIAANLSQLAATGMIPLLVYAFLFQQGLLSIIYGIGICVGAFSGLGYLLGLKSTGLFSHWRWRSELVDYGFRRYVSIISQFVLVAAVPLLMLPYVAGTGIAYFNAGLVVIRISLLVLAPISTLLLPRISAALDAGRGDEVGHGLAVMGRAVMMLSVPVAALVALNSDLILRVWLGQMADGGPVVALMMLALPAFMMQQIFRAPIDAASPRGANSIIYGAGATTLPLVFYLALSLGYDPLMAGIAAYITAYWAIVTAMIFYLGRMLQIKLFEPQFIFDLVLFWGTIVGGISLAHYTFSSTWAFIIGGLVLALSSVIYFLRWQSDWLTDLRSIILTGQPSGQIGG